jgi:hypothetical protein
MRWGTWPPLDGISSFARSYPRHRLKWMECVQSSRKLGLSEGNTRFNKATLVRTDRQSEQYLILYYSYIIQHPVCELTLFDIIPRTADEHPD